MGKKSKAEPEPTLEVIEELDTSENEIYEEITEISKETYPEPEINEVKHKTFLRLARPRTQKVLNALKILGNCSNKSSYAYTHLEIEKIFNTLGIALVDTREKFSEKLAEQKELFEF